MMLRARLATTSIVLMAAAFLAGCGGSGFSTPGSASSAADPQTAAAADGQAYLDAQNAAQTATDQRRSTIWDLFSNSADPNTTVEVNKYIWKASLEVLDFLPITSVDPFTGVIVTGYGTPPGGGRAYRATIYVQDPALDARSLHVALQSKGGPVSLETQRAIEDAILSRARQLRIADAGL
jgi:Domain of unknown function (DUF3576)